MKFNPEFLLYGLLGMVLFLITGAGSYFMIGILSFGGMTDTGLIISYYLYGIILLSTILPPIIAGTLKYRSTKSILSAFKDFFLSLLIASLPALTIFVFFKNLEYKDAIEYQDVVHQDHTDVLSWYSEVSPPNLNDIPNDWNQYEWQSDSQNQVIATLEHPSDFQLVTDGYSKYLTAGDITINFHEKIVDEEHNHDVVFTSKINDRLRVPYGGFAVNRSLAVLSKYTVGKDTVYRASQNYFDDYSYWYESLIFWEDPHIYMIEAEIKGTTDQENKAKVEIVRKIFDTLVLN